MSPPPMRPQGAAPAPEQDGCAADRFIDLLRHGETLGGARFRGVQDDQLSEKGQRQMRDAVGSDTWDGLISSPARRCADFAATLAERLERPLEVWPELGERDFGDWEGRTAAEIPLDALSRFWADPVGYTPPRAEPFAALRARALVAWQRVQQHPARRLLVITHGGIVRILLGELLGIPAARLILIEVPHATRSRIRIPGAGGQPSLVSHRGGE